jgi:hypothetical protein
VSCGEQTKEYHLCLSSMDITKGNLRIAKEDMGLSRVMSGVFFIAKSFKCGCLGGISEMSLLPLQG